MIEVDFFEADHDTESHIEGAEIVWTCPLCPSWEGRYNIETDQMSIKGSNEFKHCGKHIVRAQ